LRRAQPGGYEDFARPLSDRGIKIEQLRPDLGEVLYNAWATKADKHPY
jgi:hypothetical protein